MHAAPAGALAVSLFSSCRIESRCASSFAFSLLPSVDLSAVACLVQRSRMLCRRASSADAEVPAGNAPPNTVLNADSGEPMVGRLPPVAPP